MRGFGCLVTALLVLAGALFFADRAITSAAERQTARSVSRALKADAVVDFEGWPITAQMLSGSIARVTASAQDVPLDQGGRLDTLDLVLTDVSVNLNDLRSSGGKRLPPARTGTFEAELGEASVAGVMQLPDGVALTLDNGTATVSAGGLEVEAKVRARDGDILVSLAGPLARLVGGAEFPIDLSDQPGAPAVEDVVIENGVLTLSGSLEGVER